MNAFLKEDALGVDQSYVWPRDNVNSLYEALSSEGYEGSHCYRETVPDQLKGQVRYVESQNPTNSLDTQDYVVEILAVDANNNALIERTTVYNYEGYSNSALEMLPLANAIEVLDRYKARRDRSLEDSSIGEDPDVLPEVKPQQRRRIGQKITGYSVVSRSATPATPATTTAPPSPAPGVEADRRLTLEPVVSPLANTLKWASRPHDPDGHPSRTYRVDSPEGRFSIHVVHAENGSPTTGYPFEVWVGDGAPRGLRALCKSLSMDMRSLDRGWLKMKLESLFTAPGEAFDMTLPNGVEIRASSAVSAFARIVHHRCSQLGAFSDEKLASTPVVDALMSRKEPKAEGIGTLSWQVPISTPDRDDFEMIVKEVVFEGRIVPQSIWLSGRSFPKSLEGLAISLSFDLRVNDPQWSVLKLQQLQDMQDLHPFWAVVPGGGKSASYPSIVAYMAELILYRLRVIGMLDSHNEPTISTNLVLFDTGEQSAIGVHQLAPQHKMQLRGMLCPDCSSYTLTRQSGCDSCVCGFSRCG